MEELRNGYLVSHRCTVCTAVDRNGNALRDLIDNQKDQGVATTKLVEELKGEGVVISQPNLDKHFKKHSPWILDKARQLRRAKAQNDINREAVIHRNAEDEIQKLIDIGGKRIDEGELQVDKDMYLFALKSKTDNKTPVSIQNFLMVLGNSLIEEQETTRQIIQGQTLGEKNDGTS